MNRVRKVRNASSLWLLSKIYLRTGRSVWMDHSTHMLIEPSDGAGHAGRGVLARLLHKPNADGPMVRSRRASLEAEDEIGSHSHGMAEPLTTSIIRELGRDP